MGPLVFAIATGSRERNTVRSMTRWSGRRVEKVLPGVIAAKVGRTDAGPKTGA